MKICYISPENTVGTLKMYKKMHHLRGNEIRFITFFHSPKGFEEDICLDLPFNFTKPYLKKIRHKIYQLYRGKTGYHTEKKGYPPTWEPEGLFDRCFIEWKEKLWHPYIKKAIKKYDLDSFDVYHFESGMDFYRDARFAKHVAKHGKKVICHYHGEDMRSRGVLPELDSISDLNLTNEVDLLEKHPDINYLFLPFDVDAFSKKYGNKRKKQDQKKPLVTHAPTNRYYKGSQSIIPACRKLQAQGKCRFILIENMSHHDAMKVKARSDIFIDQVGDKGGWGYGMNSVEALALEVCTMTEMNDKYCSFIPDHPFVKTTEATIYTDLLNLLNTKERIVEYGRKGEEWVRKYHDYHAVSDKLYEYYAKIGLGL